MPITENIVIEPLNIKLVKVTIYGDVMIQHCFHEKARKQLLALQMKLKSKVGKRPKRKPKEEFELSLHIISPGKFTYLSNHEYGLGEVKFSGKIGFLASGIKKAIVASARNVDKLPMTLLRGALFIQGDDKNKELVEIKYKTLNMREDIVIVSNGNPDLRWRGELKDWETDLAIEYNADVVSASQIVNLLSVAGFSVGLAEMRPGKTGGNYGRFKVKPGQYKE